MKTIEERATKYANGNASCYSYCGRWESCKNKCHEWFLLYDRYEKIATEQRDIDNEKATEWLNANWRKYIDTDADGMIRFSGWKKDFEKAMKDENENTI